MHTILAKALGPSRRGLILASAAAGCATVGGGAADAADDAAIEADLRDYSEFGPKNAGGAGDEACGAWLETRLRTLGYAVARQAVTAAAINENAPYVRIGEARAAVASHCLGAAGAVGALRGPAQIWSAPYLTPPLERGAVVFAHLPAQRWSSAEQPLIRETMTQAFAGGAAALVLIAHGPTGELIRLNRPLRPAHGPIVLMAPREWQRLQASDGAAAVLSLNATAIERPAFNVAATLDRAAPSWLVISTPRSGWGVCAGERGPGVASLLALARLAPARLPRLNIALVATTSHEFENAGGTAYVENAAPPPGSTELWLHLGAGFAARDWHEAGGRLLPLPSADPQRFLVATSESLEAARASFAGIAELEAAYDANAGAAGELQNVIAAGYRAVGLFGAHRFHHVAQDDLRCADPRFTSAVVQRLQRFLDARLG